MAKRVILLFMGLVAFIFIYTQLTIFVVPPIGAVPEGKTLLLLRYGRNEEGNVVKLNSQFIDTADGMCKRIQGYVNLLCRGLALGSVATNSTILLRLPYSSTLHSIGDL